MGVGQNGCGSVWVWVRVDVGQRGCESVWIWVRAVVLWVKHWYGLVQSGSVRGSGQPAGNDQAKGMVWDGVSQCGCGSVWVCVRVGVSQCGCAVGQALLIVLSSLTLYWGPDNRREMTKQKVGCGSLWVWVRVGVDQSTCDVGQAFRHRPVQPVNQLEVTKQKAGFGSVWMWIRVGMGQCRCWSV